MADAQTLEPAAGGAKPVLIERACPSCGSPDRNPVGIERDGWTVCACEACGFVYLKAIPPLEAFTEDFAWDKTVEVEKKRRKDKQPIVQWLDAKTRWRLHIFPRPETRAFTEKLAEHGPVLDLGCGDGRHAMALDAGFTPYGIEIAPNLARVADAAFKTRGGHCAAEDAVSGMDAFEDGFFSAAMLNSYLEHEPRPFEVLSALRPKMRPGAPVIVKVPNYGSWNAKVMGENWCGIRLPDHVNYFTWDSLAELGEKAGYTVETPPAGTNLLTNDNMWAILRA